MNVECQKVLGTFHVSAETLADCLGVPPGYAITAAHPAADGHIEIVVVGDGTADCPGGLLQLVVEVEHGSGLFGGVIRRTRLEPVELSTEIRPG